MTCMRLKSYVFVGGPGAPSKTGSALVIFREMQAVRERAAAALQSLATSSGPPPNSDAARYPSVAQGGTSLQTASTSRHASRATQQCETLVATPAGEVAC